MSSSFQRFTQTFSFYRAKHVGPYVLPWECRLSIRLSVCNFVDCDHIQWDSRKVISHINMAILPLLGKLDILKLSENSKGNLSNLGANQGDVGKNHVFLPVQYNSSHLRNSARCHNGPRIGNHILWVRWSRDLAWNGVPSSVIAVSSLSTFRQEMKSDLFLPVEFSVTYLGRSFIISATVFSAPVAYCYLLKMTRHWLAVRCVFILTSVKILVSFWLICKH